VLITQYKLLVYPLAILLLLFGTSNLMAQADTKQPTIDVYTDSNQDGIPDDLAAKVLEINAIAESVQRAESSQAAEVTLLTAMNDFVNRLPYNMETRSLQQRLIEIQAELAQAAQADNDKAIQLFEELQQIEAAMSADPGYAATIKGLHAIFNLPSAVNTHDSLSQHTFLPIVISTGSATTTTSVKTEETVYSAAITAADFSALRRGDIMLSQGKSSWTVFVFAMNYSHSGAYDGSNLVYESNSDGARLKPLNSWKAAGAYVSLGRNNKKPSSTVENALTWAKNKWKTNGTTPYNYNYPDKNTDAKLYCSQLVWKIHSYTGVNLDSNHWSYHLYIWAKWGLAGNAFGIPAVAPDEIALDSDVTIYSSGTN
jgi:uncharacterized protein YycO